MRLRPSSFVPMSFGAWSVAFVCCVFGGVALLVIRPAWWPLGVIYIGCGLYGIYVQRRRARVRQQIHDERARLKVVRSKLRADLERRGVKVRSRSVDPWLSGQGDLR